MLYTAAEVKLDSNALENSISIIPTILTSNFTCNANKFLNFSLIDSNGIIMLLYVVL